MKQKLFGGFLAACLMGSIATSALAAEHEVLMLNGNATGSMVFEPALIKVAVGDTVKFIPKNMGHNAESVASLSPAGSIDFKGDIGKEVIVKVDKEGVYVVQCNPHAIMAMVGVIVAGNPTNLADIKEKSVILTQKFVMNKQRLSNIFAQIK